MQTYSITITYEADDEKILCSANQNQKLLDVFREHNVSIESLCGGNCVCTSCHVLVTDGYSNLTEPDSDESIQNSNCENYNKAQSRLSCQAYVTGDVELTIPVNS